MCISHQYICYQGSGQCVCEQGNLLLLPSCFRSLLPGQMEDTITPSRCGSAKRCNFQKYILRDIRKQNHTKSSWHLRHLLLKTWSNSSEKQATGEKCTANTSVTTEVVKTSRKQKCKQASEIKSIRLKWGLSWSSEGIDAEQQTYSRSDPFPSPRLLSFLPPCLLWFSVMLQRQEHLCVLPYTCAHCRCPIVPPRRSRHFNAREKV